MLSKVLAFGQVTPPGSSACETEAYPGRKVCFLAYTGARRKHWHHNYDLQSEVAAIHQCISCISASVHESATRVATHVVLTERTSLSGFPEFGVTGGGLIREHRLSDSSQTLEDTEGPLLTTHARPTTKTLSICTVPASGVCQGL